MPGTRELVLKELWQIETQGAYTNQALDRLLSQEALPPADRAFAAQLLTGVVRNQLMLDYVIEQFSRLKLKKLSPWVHLILRMGVYQILCMDRVPNRAACDEAVKLARRYAHKAAQGYVNGLLRSVAREGAAIVWPQEPMERMAVQYSCPLWLTRKLTEQYGAAVCQEILAESHRPHPPTLRVNRRKTTPAALTALLAQEGTTVKPAPGEPWALMGTGPLHVRRSPAYAQGLYTLQNISSMAAVELLNPQPGETVLDLCAAPGGKATQMAEMMEDKGRVLAFDLYPHKAELIEKAARRLGLGCIQARAQDAALPLPELADRADRVLVDAPCSGIGVIHKKPDIKWRRKPEDIPALCEVQARILETAGGYVKPGGVLVYATCTILREENQEQTARFLAARPEFTLEAERLLLTHETGGSGFYMARLRRKR